MLPKQHQLIYWDYFEIKKWLGGSEKDWNELWSWMVVNWNLSKEMTFEFSHLEELPKRLVLLRDRAAKEFPGIVRVSW